MSQMHRDRSLLQEAMARQAAEKAAQLSSLPEDTPLLQQQHNSSANGLPLVGDLRTGAGSKSLQGRRVIRRYGQEQRDPEEEQPIR